jgi:hypothetical protein
MTFSRIGARQGWPVPVRSGAAQIAFGEEERRDEKRERRNKPVAV